MESEHFLGEMCLSLVTHLVSLPIVQQQGVGPDLLPEQVSDFIHSGSRRRPVAPRRLLEPAEERLLGTAPLAPLAVILQQILILCGVLCNNRNSAIPS